MPKKILIVGPAWVGDMVMAQSLFKVLKQADPSCRIDVLSPAWTSALLTRMPEVTKHLELPLGHGILALKARYQIGKSLRAEQYDEAFVLPNSWKSAIIPWAAKIPKRTGWRGEWRYGLLNDIRTLVPKNYPLMVERFVALSQLPKAPLPNIPRPELVADVTRREQTLQKLGLSSQTAPLLALCPGAEFGPSKRWPESHYAELARTKIAEGWNVWILGSAKDAEVAEQIVAATAGKCINLAGKTSLPEVIDLLSLASVVVSNDSGLMHIAAALARPLVAVYGSTSPDFTPPLASDVRIVKLTLPCQPCFKRTCPLTHHHCMQLLPASQVLQAIRELKTVCAS